MCQSCTVSLSIAKCVNGSVILTLSYIQVTQSFVQFFSACSFTQVRLGSGFVTLSQSDKTHVHVSFGRILDRKRFLEISFSLVKVTGLVSQLTEVVICTVVVRVDLSSFDEDSFLLGGIVSQSSCIQQFFDVQLLSVAISQRCDFFVRLTDYVVVQSQTRTTQLRKDFFSQSLVYRRDVFDFLFSLFGIRVH